MHSLRISLSSLAIVCTLGVASFGTVGCHASVTTGEAVPPPPPPAPPPPPDRDTDGITDASDACPDKAGPANDDATKNGCPVEAAPAPVEAKHVEIVGNEVRISEKIMFDTAKSTVKPESSGLLDEIAAVIKTGGQAIDLIEVEGHADKVGEEKANLKLTDERAKAVVDELVKRGVDPKKLRAKGYGMYCPLDEGSTPEALEKNRRVEFTILKVGGKPTVGANVGCDNATKHGVKAGPVL